MLSIRAALMAGVVTVSGLSCAAGALAPWDARLAVMGRVHRPASDRLRFGYPGVSVRLAFEGTSLAARLSGTTANSRLAVIVDSGPPRTVRVPRDEASVVLAQGLPRGRHQIDIVHRTETWQGTVTLREFVLPGGGRWLEPKPWPSRRLLFIGDSVTCGEGVGREPAAPPTCGNDAAATSDAHLSYGMLLARALDAQAHLVCYGGRGLIRDWRGNRKVVNAPRFFHLSIVDPPGRAGWDHATYVPDAIVVSLGTNDFNPDLGDFPEREEFVSAYAAFVREIRTRAPHAQVFLTEGAIAYDMLEPARPGKTLLRQYLAETIRRLGDPGVHLAESAHHAGDACDAHPTREQHAAMARELEPVIRGALGW